MRCDVEGHIGDRILILVNQSLNGLRPGTNRIKVTTSPSRYQARPPQIYSSKTEKPWCVAVSKPEVYGEIVNQAGTVK